MSRKVRLNDYARVIIKDGGGIVYESRSSTGRGHQFGDAQRIWIPEDEMRQIVEEYDNDN